MRTEPARRALKRQVLALAVSAAFQPIASAQTLPTGGEVKYGQATISESPGLMQINQASGKAVLEWQSFSIGASGRVEFFQQQGPSSVALNRVLGNNPSEIFGSLTANGRVFLVNPSGVYFAPGASVSVGGLVASTLSISNEDFLAGRYVFSNGGGAGSVVNDGSINSHSGYTALLGTKVTNNGFILANAGSVALAAGDRVSLDMVGDNLIRVSVDQAALDAALVNKGSIEASGGNVLLSASRANDVLDSVLNTDGIVRASGLTMLDGEIVLDGGQRGHVNVAGDLSARRVAIAAGEGLAFTAAVNAEALDVSAAGDAIIGANVFATGPIDIRGTGADSSLLFHGSNIFSLGRLDIQASGDVSLVGDALASTQATSAGQSVKARSLALTASDGGFVSLTNNPGGEQVIALDGGNLDVRALGGGFALLVNAAPDGQSISLAGGGITVVADAGDPSAFASAAINSNAAQRISARSLAVSAARGGAAGLNADGFNPDQQDHQEISLIGGDLSVDAHEGGNVSLVAFSGNQTLSLVGGGSVDVRNTGTNGRVELSSFFGDQTISVRDGDHIGINATQGAIFIGAGGGAQTLSMTGAGRNAVEIGSSGTGRISVNGASQQFIAGSGNENGSIAVIDSDGPDNFTQIISNAFASGEGTQSISTSGSLRVVSGARPEGTPFLTGFVHTGTGLQTIVADSMEIRGGPAGAANPATILSVGGGAQEVRLAGDLVVLGGPGGAAELFSNGPQSIKAANIFVQGASEGTANGAFIRTDPGVSQYIEVPGQIVVSTGDGGSNNGAGINSRGSQAIVGRPDISVIGGAGAAAATIQGLGGLQQIEARSIFMTNAESSPVNSAAVIQGPLQRIDVSGDVTLVARSGTGTSSGVRIGAQGAGATDLELKVGGNLLLRGGTSGTNGSALGGSGSGVTNRNDIVVAVQGDVILDGVVGGGGARIGNSVLTPMQEGNISVTARSILFTGSAPAAIRTLGDVTLNAGSIQQGTNGLVLASGLTTISDGATTLAGANQVARYHGTSFAGDITLNNTGDLELAGLSAVNASIANAGNLAVTGFANANGAMDVQVGGGNLEVGPGGQLFASGDQSIRVIDGDRIMVQGGDLFAGMLSGGSQTISITGTRENAIILGSAGALGTSVLNGLQQQITAGLPGEQGSITLTGADSFSGFVGITTQSGVGTETQSVSTSGALRVLAGDAPAKTPDTPTGIFHNRQGTQTIVADSIEIVGGASGSGNNAFVNSNGGGDQQVTVPGALQLHGNAGGNAGIGINPGPFSPRRGHQSIDAGSIFLTNSLGGGGINTSASITGATQDIETTGDVVLQAGASGGDITGVRIGGRSGDATDLDLTVGGRLRLIGGSAGNNGAAIGGSSAGVAGDNRIRIVAGGDVVLDGASGGAGVRIGSSPRNGITGGEIDITAANIRFTGNSPAAIRTLGNLELNANAFLGAIEQGPNGFVLADALTTTSSGATTLAGPNQVARYDGTSVAGEITLNNIGALSLTSLNALGATVTNAGSVTIAGFVFAQGAMNLDVDGALAVSASGEQDATLNSLGDLSIRAQSMSVSAQEGRAAQVIAFGGDQSISLEGGSFDATTGPGGGLVEISANGGEQTISVRDGDHIAVNPLGGGQAFLFAGAQTLSITGSGRNAIEIGSAGALGSTFLNADSQHLVAGVGAEAGAIAVTGSTAPSFTQVTTNLGGGGTQAIETSGEVRIVANAAPTSFPPLTGFAHFGSGAQTIHAQSLRLQGAGTPATILSNGGAQLVHVTGDLVLVGGAGGSANLVGLGEQTISGRPDIVVVGGAGGNAVIQGLGALQTIEANSIFVTNAEGSPVNSAGAIQGAHQRIDVGGDVTLVGRSGTGTASGARIGAQGAGATDLVLTVGGDLLLQGGSSGTNGAALGGSGSGVTNRNDIVVAVQGDVILDGAVGGGGVRIGNSVLTPMQEGNISVTARSILFTGSAPAAIRTLGDVSLNALEITEAPSGLIAAGGLTTASSGATSLVGQNQVSRFSGTTGFGDLTLNNSGPLEVSSLFASNATLTNAGPVHISGLWNTLGNTAMATTGTGSSLLVTGTVFANGEMNIDVSGDFTVRGGGAPNHVASVGDQTINVTGGSLDLEGIVAFTQIASHGGNQTVTVRDGDHLRIVSENTALTAMSAAGTQTLSITGSGRNAMEFGREGGTGSILVSAPTLRLTAGIGSESGSITITGPAAPGTSVQVGAGFPFPAPGEQKISTTGALTVAGGSRPDDLFIVTGIVHNGFGPQSISAGSLELRGGAEGSGNLATIISIAGGEQVIDVRGDLTLLAGPGGFAQLFSNGAQSVTAANALLQGASSGAGANASVTAVGAGQRIDLAGDLVLLGGPGGQAQLFTDAAQSIRASNLRLQGAVYGANGGAFVNGAGQDIDVSGDIIVAGGGGDNNGSGIHSNNVLQSIRASNLWLQGGSSGSNNGAFVTTSPGASQYIEVPGQINVRTGDGGSNNGAGINSRGSQTIVGRPDINVIAGAGATAATIQGLGGLQHIEARNIFMTNAESSPSNSAAVIQGPLQRIDASGDVALLSRSGTGTASGVRIGAQGAGATDLELRVGGNLLLRGGTSGSNGASLGGSGTAPTNGSDVTVMVAGDVILDGAAGGGGVRIGNSAAVPMQEGNISVAARSILFTGQAPAAIRTLGNVTLRAGSIQQEANGFILASGLTTASEGSTLLGGTNDVASFSGVAGGDLLLRNLSSFLTLGPVAAAGSLTLDQGGSLFIGAGESPLVVRGGTVNVSTGGDLALRGGTGYRARAELVSGGDIDATIGGVVTLDKGLGDETWARIRSEGEGSVMRFAFPNLTSGGFFVDGVEGSVKHGLSGFYILNKPVKIDETLLLEYQQ